MSPFSGFGILNVSYVDKKIEAIKASGEQRLKEQAKKKVLLKDQSKY
jgi:hypothetical protein